HEAEQNGGRLGQIGGYIVACTLLNMLLLDEESYINQDPGFDPFSLLPNSGSMMAGIVNAVSMVPA
ncbi:MAG: hypothetical protein KDC44_19140, partial [Phaeodactylibacter sp.]|nr:hypothetical protein [Phaeodactylibacter sp.]